MHLLTHLTLISLPHTLPLNIKNTGAERTEGIDVEGDIFEAPCLKSKSLIDFLDRHCSLLMTQLTHQYKR